MKAPRKIMVIDDDPVVGKSFDRVLAAKGYAVITAASGEEALEKLRHEKYDVVFTDIRMPGMSGLEVAERVKAGQPWLPVVIVTGYGSQEYETRAEAAGVAGFLRKPLSPEMIEESTLNALREGEAADKAQPAGAAAVAAVEVAVAAPAVTGANAVAQAVKNVALFFAAPFVGLAYILALPFVGFCMLAWIGGKAMMKHAATRKIAVLAKTAGMLIAAPFIGLAYILVLPFAGLAMLAWIGGRALLKRDGTE